MVRSGSWHAYIPDSEGCSSSAGSVDHCHCLLEYCKLPWKSATHIVDRDISDVPSHSCDRVYAHIGLNKPGLSSTLIQFYHAVSKHFPPAISRKNIEAVPLRGRPTRFSNRQQFGLAKRQARNSAREIDLKRRCQSERFIAKLVNITIEELGLTVMKLE